MNESTRQALRQRLQQPGLLVAPGVFDMVSLRLADTFGFDALYMTGYGTVASHMGLPDAGLATYSDMVGRVTAMARMARTPLIADADTGYGGLLNMRHTIQGYEAAGAAAIQLEDQEFPKKCGHTPGRRVIPMDDMVRKIRVAVDARTDPNFLIIARTDARTSLGLDEALRRAELYLRAGADILFVESPETEEELARIAQTFKGTPLLVNNVEGGRTPILPPATLQQMGFRVAIYPGLGFLSAGHALREAYGNLLASSRGQNKGVHTANTPLYNFNDFSLLMGFQQVWDFDKRQAGLPPVK
ncbi:MAG: carboxyvinyl-carboxyphosphonate phosphorylmutase [Betaproteobacteria bacterium]|nr:carboxyvinyl-carboxyphosphonate phosphorylmutase [Betaproteobacteria bacterium]